MGLALGLGPFEGGGGGGAAAAADYERRVIERLAERRADLEVVSETTWRTVDAGRRAERRRVGGASAARQSTRRRHHPISPFPAEPTPTFRIYSYCKLTRPASTYSRAHP
jgi:hypothetical protein